MKMQEKMPNFLSVIRTKIPRHFTQVLATLAVSLGPFAAGLGKGYSSPALASLQDSKTSTFPVSPQEGSWIASLSLLGAIFGCLAGGLMLQLGRKMSLLLVALPFSGSWLLTVFAQRVELLYSTSFIGGFFSAVTLLATQVYVSEISHPEIRGCLSAILKMAGQLGTLCSTTLGAFLDWRQLAGVAAVAPILFFLAILPIPETPSFLLFHGKEEEASKSLSWLRSHDEDIVSEIETLKSNIQSKERKFIPRFSSQLTKPLFITCGLMFFHKFSGVTVFHHYAVPIFQHVYNRSRNSIIDEEHFSNVSFSPAHLELDMASNVTELDTISNATVNQIMVFGRSLNPHGAAIVVLFLQLLGSMTSGLLIDTAGRLPLLIVSNLFISGSFFGFGLYNWMEDSLPPSQSGFGPSLDWIPLTCVLFFTLFFSIGIGPISWLMVGELFPLEFRGIGGAICTAFSYACAFAVVKTYEDMKSSIGLYGAFWVYSGVSIAGLFFACCAVPETKGVELEEMHHTRNLPSEGRTENHVLVPLATTPKPTNNITETLPKQNIIIKPTTNHNNNNSSTRLPISKLQHHHQPSTNYQQEKILNNSTVLINKNQEPTGYTNPFYTTNPYYNINTQTTPNSRPTNDILDDPEDFISDDEYLGLGQPYNRISYPFPQSYLPSYQDYREEKLRNYYYPSSQYQYQQHHHQYSTVPHHHDLVDHEYNPIHMQNTSSLSSENYYDKHLISRSSNPIHYFQSRLPYKGTSV